jgi:hypothetical protein
VAIRLRPQAEAFLRDPLGGKAYRRQKPAPRLGRDVLARLL